MTLSSSLVVPDYGLVGPVGVSIKAALLGGKGSNLEHITKRER